jgi:hypothetical protein
LVFIFPDDVGNLRKYPKLIKQKTLAGSGLTDALAVRQMEIEIQREIIQAVGQAARNHTEC